LWERAARAAVTNGDWAVAIEHASRASDYYLDRGQVRAAARAQATAGQALRLWGRHAEARDQLTAAVKVLRAEPDADTVRALDQLAILEVVAGSPDADTLSTEALTLGQALVVDPGTLGHLFITRGIYLNFAGRRRPQAAAYFREAARLATQADDNLALGRALLNLADPLAVSDPAAAAEAARAAAGHLRRIGARDRLAFAISNLAQALLTLGDWDAVQAELTQAAEADGLADHGLLACDRGWLAALRGDTATAQTMRAGLGDLRASEDRRTRPKSASWRPSPQLPTASHRTRCATPAPPLPTLTPSGSATSSCAGHGRWPPAPPTTWGTPPPSASSSPCSTPTSPGT